MIWKKSICFYPTFFPSTAARHALAFGFASREDRSKESNQRVRKPIGSLSHRASFYSNFYKGESKEKFLTFGFFLKSLKSSLHSVNVKKEESLSNNKELKMFFNQCFDKGRLKNFVLWFLLNYGENKTVRLVEQLKNVGFYYASKAGISLGIEDLKIPPKKINLIFDAEKETSLTIHQFKRGEITGVERFQRLIDIWHHTSEFLKQEVINHFEATDILNPVYMMAFSGARGNISQVRQLVGMRGLMSDPQGQILDFPIRSNFREGLTLTEYIISSYGARKGIVDTALRTANAGYLTRRLVDVAQHVIITNFDCQTKRGIYLTNMKEGNKTIYSLSQKLVGRILARDLFTVPVTTSNTVIASTSLEDSHYKKATSYEKKGNEKIASRNEEITSILAAEISKKFEKVFVRSPLTCEKLICQLCYGWSLAQGKLVSIGEAVGVVAAQSIGEPGTQLTMRTFHTGGVFAGDVSDQIKAPFNGVIEYVTAIAGTLIRTPQGKIAFLTKSEGSLIVHKTKRFSGSHQVSAQIQEKSSFDTIDTIKQKMEKQESRKFKIPPYTLLYLRNGQNVVEKEVIAQISSISQKTNATDSAEFTIKSEIEGQFYTKSLILREKFVGPILKKKQKEEEFHSFFQNIEFDKFYEAWTWGYAWILAGKVYEFKNCSYSLPIIGDFLNTKSYMSQIHWSISLYKGENLDYEYNKRTPFGNPLDVSLENPHRSQRKLLNATESENQVRDKRKENNRKTIPFQIKQILFLDIKNIVYKKYSYALELSKKTQFLKPSLSGLLFNLGEDGARRPTSAYEQGGKNFFFKKEHKNTDFLFFNKPMYLSPHRRIGQGQENFLSIENKVNKSNNSFKDFPYFLQWFPNKYKTNTEGSFIIEIPSFFHSSFINANKVSGIRLGLDGVRLGVRLATQRRPTQRRPTHRRPVFAPQLHRGETKEHVGLSLENQIQSLFKLSLNQTKDRKNKYLNKKLERLSLLKRREFVFNNSKFLWIPYFLFKISNFLTTNKKITNLITSKESLFNQNENMHLNRNDLYGQEWASSFFGAHLLPEYKNQLSASKNLNLKQAKTTIINRKQFLSFYTNKIESLQTNRQGNFYLFESSPSNGERSRGDLTRTFSHYNLNKDVQLVNSTLSLFKQKECSSFLKFKKSTTYTKKYNFSQDKKEVYKSQKSFNLKSKKFSVYSNQKTLVKLQKLVFDQSSGGPQISKKNLLKTLFLQNNSQFMSLKSYCKIVESRFEFKKFFPEFNIDLLLSIDSVKKTSSAFGLGLSNMQKPIYAVLYDEYGARRPHPAYEQTPVKKTQARDTIKSKSTLRFSFTALQSPVSSSFRPRSSSSTQTKTQRLGTQLKTHLGNAKQKSNLALAQVKVLSENSKQRKRLYFLMKYFNANLKLIKISKNLEQNSLQLNSFKNKKTFFNFISLIFNHSSIFEIKNFLYNKNLYKNKAKINTCLFTDSMTTLSVLQNKIGNTVQNPTFKLLIPTDFEVPSMSPRQVLERRPKGGHLTRVEDEGQYEGVRSPGVDIEGVSIEPQDSGEDQKTKIPFVNKEDNKNVNYSSSLSLPLEKKSFYHVIAKKGWVVIPTRLNYSKNDSNNLHLVHSKGSEDNGVANDPHQSQLISIKPFRSSFAVAQSKAASTARHDLRHSVGPRQVLGRRLGSRKRGSFPSSASGGPNETTKTKTVSLVNYLNYHKQLNLAGQIIFDNISFNTSIFIESLLLNNIFNIENISSLSYLVNILNLQLSSSNKAGKYSNSQLFKGTHDSITKSDNNAKKIFWVKNKKSRYFMDFSSNSHQEISNEKKSFINSSKINEKLLSSSEADSTRAQNGNNNSSTYVNKNIIEIESLRLPFNSIEDLMVAPSWASSGHQVSDQVPDQVPKQVPNQVFNQPPYQAPDIKILNEHKNQVNADNNNVPCIGFLCQPIQEFEQMNNIDIKKYIYQYNQNSINLESVPIYQDSFNYFSLPFPSYRDEETRGSMVGNDHRGGVLRGDIYKLNLNKKADLRVDTQNTKQKNTKQKNTKQKNTGSMNKAKTILKNEIKLFKKIRQFKNISSFGLDSFCTKTSSSLDQTKIKTQQGTPFKPVSIYYSFVKNKPNKKIKTFIKNKKKLFKDLMSYKKKKLLYAALLSQRGSIATPSIVWGSLAAPSYWPSSSTRAKTEAEARGGDRTPGSSSESNSTRTDRGGGLRALSAMQRQRAPGSSSESNSTRTDRGERKRSSFSIWSKSKTKIFVNKSFNFLFNLQLSNFSLRKIKISPLFGVYLRKNYTQTDFPLSLDQKLQRKGTTLNGQLLNVPTRSSSESKTRTKKVQLNLNKKNKIITLSFLFLKDKFLAFGPRLQLGRRPNTKAKLEFVKNILPKSYGIYNLLGSQLLSKFPRALSFPKGKRNYKINSNLLIKKVINKYRNSNSIQFSSQSMLVHSRKSINFSSFLLSYNNNSNFPLSLNNGKKFKFSYNPISHFDSSFYPFLSTELIHIFNFYLKQSTYSPPVALIDVYNKADAFELPIYARLATIENKNFGVVSGEDQYRIKGKNKIKNLNIYAGFNNLINNIFECPCFSFNITNSLDLFYLKNTATQNTQFFYLNDLNQTYSLFVHYLNKSKANQQKIAQTSFYSPFKGELVYIQTASILPSYLDKEKSLESNIDIQGSMLAKGSHRKSITEKLPVLPINTSCMILTKKDLVSYSFSSPKIRSNTLQKKFLFQSSSESDLARKKTKNRKVSNFRISSPNYDYIVNDTLIKFLNMGLDGRSQPSRGSSFENSMKTKFQKNQLIDHLSLNLNSNSKEKNNFLTLSKTKVGVPLQRNSPFRKINYIKSKKFFKHYDFNAEIKTNESNTKQQISISLLGDFYMCGDPILYSSENITDSLITKDSQVEYDNRNNQPSHSKEPFYYSNEMVSVQSSGQLIHYNNNKITLRNAQPIFISSKGRLHKFDGDFIEPKTPVITLSYQKLKTGDIIQGIPKVEQFFEARTTKRGRLFRDSLPSLLKALFKRYQSKLPLELAVRQSFYKIQQIIVDGVQRVYKSQGVTISDKHLEVIVKQMTSKVRILDGAQTGFFPGEVVDLSFVEKINFFLIKKITYEPLVLGITKSSLEVDSFLSASSFQQTTRVLSQAAIYRKKDFLKGLKENVILGNLIPAGTGYLVYIDNF